MHLKHDAVFPKLLKPIDPHRHVAESRIGNHHVALNDGLHHNEMVEALQPHRYDHRRLFKSKVLDRHPAVGFRMVSPCDREVLQVQKRKSTPRPHPLRVDPVQKPNYDRRLRRIVLEVVGQQRAQRRSAATHIPALPHHAFAANLFEAANIFAPLCLRSGSVIVLSACGGREERKARHAGSQSGNKYGARPVHQCFPVKLVCVRVPTVELMLTFRFSSTLMFEFTALMLTSELKFCCAPPFSVSVPVFVPVTGPDSTCSVPALVTRPFTVGTEP